MDEETRNAIKEIREIQDLTTKAISKLSETCVGNSEYCRLLMDTMISQFEQNQKRQEVDLGILNLTHKRITSTGDLLGITVGLLRNCVDEEDLDMVDNLEQLLKDFKKECSDSISKFIAKSESNNEHIEAHIQALRDTLDSIRNKED